MSRYSLSAVVRYLRQLTRVQPDNGATDAELLERYVRNRDEAAFELLLWRHGTLVFNVCRRMLPCEQDAEDAFQATFLAFVRKAGSISRRGSVAAWLHKVAYRIALAAQARARKIAAHEKPSGDAREAAAAPDPEWAELRPILDEEINRLPERLRLPFVLCYLEGKTNEEAARQLGCPAGTIFSRLARGREMLRRRLERRGVTLTLATLTAALTAHAAEAMPAATLLTDTARSALLFAAGSTVGGVSTQATALAEGVLKTMFMTKLKMTALVVLIAGLLAAGGVFARQALNADQQTDDPKSLKPIVSVVHPTPGGLQRTSRYSGSVQPVAQQQVCPVVSGIVKRLAVDLGDAVKKGDVLAEIDAPLLEMEVQQARAALELEQKQVEAAKADVETAKAEVRAASDRASALESKLQSDKASLEYRRKQAKRYEGLLRDRAISSELVEEQEDRLQAAIQIVNSTRQSLDNVRSEIRVKESKVKSSQVALEIAMSKVEMSRLAVQRAEMQLGFAVLRANLDGVVAVRNANTGETVSAGDPGGRRSLLTVMRTNPIRVVVGVTESDVPFIRPGAAVHLYAAYPDIKFPDCMVSRMGYVIDKKFRTMPVEIDVPNPKNLLRPGMWIQADIVLVKKASANAVTVPKSSVVWLKGHSYVYIVREDKAYRMPVRVSHESGDKMEIESGLQSSDRIVVDPRALEGEVVPVEVKKTR